MAQESSSWQVAATRTTPPRAAAPPDAVPLTWAHDIQTGAPRYIHDPAVVDAKTPCRCPACDMELTPVLAGHPQRRNPTAHFRHPKGSQKVACALVAARLAAIGHLLERGFIDLPRRRMSSNAVGFSGQGYEGWAEMPAQRILIHGAVLYDHATALLTLDDGRQFLVDLTGQRDAGSDGQGRAIVTMFLSDPALAMMSPDELYARLRLLPDIQWCAHWNDEALQKAATADAEKNARDGADAWSAEDEAQFVRKLPAGLDPAIAQQWRRETLLHREVKSILMQASQLHTPSMKVSVVREAPDESNGERPETTLRATWLCASETLQLEKVELEHRRGKIVPDVICTLREPRPYLFGATETWHDGEFDELIEETTSHQQWPLDCLVEVTVTHGIDAEKLRRIQALNMPTLEINIGSLGGRVTPEGLRQLVVHETIGKRWVHHPAWQRRRRYLEETLDQHHVTLELQQRLAELRRPLQLATPAAQCAQQYLAAAMDFFDANTRIEKVRRNFQGSGEQPELLGTDSKPWRILMQAAEALAAHGFPGAADGAMLGSAGIVSRLLSIQNNRGVGYAMGTGYQVLSAIMQSRGHYCEWHTLYTIAVKSYGLERVFNAKQAGRYASWRRSIIDKVAAGDETHLRPERYDAVLSVLYPEMQQRLSTGYGCRPQA